MKLALSLLSLAVIAASGTTASASYLESCAFDAEVVKVTRAATLDGRNSSNEASSDFTPIAVIKIIAAVDKGSHAPGACASRVGTEEILVQKKGETVTAGQALKIDYFYVNGLSPNGIAESESWKVVKLMPPVPASR